MTFEQKAREIAESVSDNWDMAHMGQEFAMCKEAARLGIIEGLEMALKIAVQNDSMEGHGAITATAIRALIEEQKV